MYISHILSGLFKGKESIDVILEELEEKQGQNIQTFENFPRVSIRRLGRLLPNARWVCLYGVSLKSDCLVIYVSL